MANQFSYRKHNPMICIRLNRRLSIAVAIGVANISCKSLETKSKQGEVNIGNDAIINSTPNHAIKGSAPIIDSLEKFGEFLQLFVSDENAQRNSIQASLRCSYIDINAQPEPKTKYEVLAIEDIEFPVFPLDSIRKQRSLLYKIDSLSQDSVIVTLLKPDTDYQVRYHFRRNSKWILDWLEDQSL